MPAQQQKNPGVVDDPIVDALAVFVTATLADAFDLRAEEAMWVAHHLTQAFLPLRGKVPEQVPLPVSHEIAQGVYSQRLRDLDRAAPTGVPAVAAPEVKYAGPEEWAAVVMQMAETCYMLRPMVESQMRGKLIGILREMGVGRPKAPRASKYLPADVLDLLLRRSQNE